MKCFNNGGLPGNDGDNVVVGHRARSPLSRVERNTKESARGKMEKSCERGRDGDR